MFYTFFHPIPLFLGSALLIYFFFRKHKKTAYLILALLALVSSLPIVVNTLIQDWESEFAASPEVDPSRSYHILVLGAGKNDDTRLSGNQRLSEQALARLVEGVKWARRLPSSVLIGSGPIVDGDKSQALLMKETAMLLGVPEERLAVQEEVYDTGTEAAAYVRAFGIDTPLILCTSAIHLPRAVRLFQLQGVKEVIPAPAHYLAPRPKKMRFTAWVPSLRSFDKWQSYLKEVVGYHLAL